MATFREAHQIGISGFLPTFLYVTGDYTARHNYDDWLSVCTVVWCSSMRMGWSFRFHFVCCLCSPGLSCDASLCDPRLQEIWKDVLELQSAFWSLISELKKASTCVKSPLNENCLVKGVWKSCLICWCASSTLWIAKPKTLKKSSKLYQITS